MSNRGGITINMHHPTTSDLTELSVGTFVLYIQDEDANGLSLFIERDKDLEFVKQLASFSVKALTLLTRNDDTDEEDTEEDE